MTSNKTTEQSNALRGFIPGNFFYLKNPCPLRLCG
jgi:hypothetical protein